MSMSAAPEKREKPDAPSASTVAPAQPDSTAATARTERRSFVLSMIALAVLLFASTEALLYFRWATMTEPTSVLIIYAGEPIRGAQIEVDGVVLSQPHKVVVGDHDRFDLPFYLEPGRYSVKIKMNDEVFFHTDVEIPKNQGLSLDLRKLVPPAAPATLPTTIPSSSFPPIL
jgi:hypothetical protein